MNKFVKAAVGSTLALAATTGAFAATADAAPAAHSYSLSQWRGVAGGGYAGGSYHSARQVADVASGIDYSNATTTRISYIEVQAILDSYHGNHLVLDGIKGAGTTNAIKSFQRSKGLAADGIVGEATAKKLFMLGYGSAIHKESASRIYTTN